MAKMFSKFRSGLVVFALTGALFAPGLVLSADAGQPMHDLVYDAGRDVNTSYHYKRGVTHFEARDYSKAYRSFYRVLQEKPQDANANFYMARVKAMRGNHKGAIKNYKTSLRYYAGSPVLLAGLADSYVKSNQPVKARGILSKLENMSKDCDITCKGAPQIAISLHIVALSLFPDPNRVETQTQ